MALFVGKLIEIKRPFDFVEAIASLREVASEAQIAALREPGAFARAVA